MLSFLAMDFGETLRMSLIAVLLFWGWIFIAIYRRPDKPTSCIAESINLVVHQRASAIEAINQARKVRGSMKELLA